MNNIYLPSGDGICGVKEKDAVSCFIEKNGRKSLKTTKNKFKVSSFPFLRGLMLFVLGFVFYFSLLSQKFADAFVETKQKKIFSFSNICFVLIVVLIVLFVSFFLLGFLPAKISFLIVDFSPNIYLRNFVIAILKVFILFAIFLVIRFLPFMQDLFQFNSACNIADKSLAKVEDLKIFDWHLPTNFLNFAIFSFLLSTFVITLVGISLSFWLNWIINLLIFVLIISSSYEILHLLNLNEKTKKFCIVTSFLVCIKPSTIHDEIARIVCMELNSKQLGEKMEEKRISRSMIESEMQTKLSKVNKYEKSDVDWIIATILGKNRQEAKLTRTFDEKTYREIIKATNERAQGKPLSAIFGFVEFFGLKFFVNKKVLTPRMETEILVEKALEEISKVKKCEVLDICTGSGAIAVSVSRNSDAKVTAVDISKSALMVAKENADANLAKINFIQSNMFEALKKSKKFDIIISNPPYIRTIDLNGLDEEVKNFDPKLSLDGGADGYDFYRDIAINASKHIKKNGWIFLEIGKGQFSTVKKLLIQNGWVDVVGIKDYNKIYRVVKARYGNGK